MSSTYTTFAEAQEAFLQHCGFPKELIETSISEVAKGIKNAQMRYDGKTVYIMYLGGIGGSQTKVLISYKHESAAAFLSDVSTAEKKAIEDAATSAAPLHPAAVPVIILEQACRTLSQDIKDIDERTKSMESIQADTPKPPPMSQQLLDIAKSINSYKRGLAQLKTTHSSVQKLLGHFEKQFGSDVQQTLEDQLANVLPSVEHGGAVLAEAEANIAAYKAWLDAQVAKSQHLMAIDGWKDGKSNYTMSVMGLMFWPTTITSLFLNLPFWDWNASDEQDIVNPRWTFIVPVLWGVSMLCTFLWVIGTWVSIHFSDVNDVEDE
ncbi:hypothetical protein BDZ45DRAFT_692052 [Acephala macrosclerotiorum]|nr:hypothetical protein BDZ45DRAFT_692052 [Acephala macrosclerotiorum]